MSLLMQPAHVPLGFVEVKPGVRLPVYINPPWQRMLGNGLQGALDDAGRVPPPAMFADSAGDEGEPMIIPGPQGEPGRETVSYVLLAEEAEDNYFFIPMS